MSTPHPSPLIPWILRIGVAGCFIGHGAFGIITKSAWVPYFAIAGIPEPFAWRLMPWIGAMDILIGFLALAWPCRALFAWGAVWAIWTALCRPLAGEPFWETLERAGNYGVPLAILAAVSLRGPWFKSLPSQWSQLADDRARARLAWTLRLTTFTLLIGHAGLGFFVQKPALTDHYTSLWSAAPSDTVVWIGAFEFAFAALILMCPLPAVLFATCAWKLSTESLFVVAGAPVWEVIERFGSYTAPLALAFLLARSRNEKFPRLSTAAA